MSAAMILALPLSASATLVSTDGGLGVFDTTNNVTWTSNANLFETQAQSFSGGTAAFVSLVIADSGGVIHDTLSAADTVPFSGTYTLSAAADFHTANDGGMSWWGAEAWINYLNTIDYGGSNQWALPTTVNGESSAGFPDGASGDPAQSSSQLALLFYGGLGQVAHQSITTTHNSSFALFTNIQNNTYLSSEFSAAPNGAWDFGTSNGFQSFSTKACCSFALAVSPGQISAVPLPGAAWLFLGSIGGLGALARKRRAA
jgi:hypothetical protein